MPSDAPTGVQAGMLEKNARNQRNQQIGMRDADLWERSISATMLSRYSIERAGVDVAAHKEVRDRGPALRGAFGHDAAE